MAGKRLHETTGPPVRSNVKEGRVLSRHPEGEAKGSSSPPERRRKRVRMLRKKIIIRDAHGLHLRPATRIVKACLGMDSTVTISKGRRNANARSILELLLLDAESGSEIEIVVEGREEEIALKKVIGLFD
jgi:phosphotransferase system HPr (HPr) family protein